LWRERFELPLVGITGSNGKTTVKQLLASVFEAAGNVHATRANDNNEVGVPQTLLGLTAQHDYAVVEMGASGAGEIQRLSEITQPGISVITNAGAAHLEGFGDAEAVAKEKGWIYRNLKDDGIAVVNADDAFCDYWKSLCALEHTARQIITFGANGEVTTTRQSNGSVTLTYAKEGDANQEINFDFQLAGDHNVINAAAVAACAIAAGIPLSVIAKGLAAATPVAGRLNFHTLANVTLIDDTYNANPASTRAAIDVLRDFDGDRYLVLGDLLELGAEEVEQHKAIGVYAHANRVDRLLAFGELSKHTVDAFGDGAQWFDDKQSIVDTLQHELNLGSSELNSSVSGSAVLVKGSRSMHMEEIVAGLSNHAAPSRTTREQATPQQTLQGACSQ